MKLVIVDEGSQGRHHQAAVVGQHRGQLVEHVKLQPPLPQLRVARRLQRPPCQAPFVVVLAAVLALDFLEQTQVGRSLGPPHAVCLQLRDHPQVRRAIGLVVLVTNHPVREENDVRLIKVVVLVEAGILPRKLKRLVQVCVLRLAFPHGPSVRELADLGSKLPLPAVGGVVVVKLNLWGCPELDRSHPDPAACDLRSQALHHVGGEALGHAPREATAVADGGGTVEYEQDLCGVGAQAFCSFGGGCGRGGGGGRGRAS